MLKTLDSVVLVRPRVTSQVQSHWESVINKSDEFYSLDGRLGGALEKNATADWLSVDHWSMFV